MFNIANNFEKFDFSKFQYRRYWCNNIKLIYLHIITLKDLIKNSSTYKLLYKLQTKSEKSHRSI